MENADGFKKFSFSKINPFKSQIISTKFQTFVILNFGHCDLFDICALESGI
jgi:hypothetical protein